MDRQIEKGSDSKALMAKERLAKLPQGKNVTPEYYKTAAPGTGIISREAGYKEKIHADEIKTAELLHNQFGGNITLLTESNTDKQKTADYLWNGKLWELKTPTSTKATDNSVRRGLKQIADNPGGIILNYENAKVNTTDIESVIEGRMRRGHEQSADIMIIKNDVVEKVIRYGK